MVKNKFTESINNQLDEIARQKAYLALQLENLEAQEEGLQAQKQEIESQFFCQTTRGTFVQKVSESHFVEKNTQFDIVAQIFDISPILNGEYVWEYSIKTDGQKYPLKSTKFNHVAEISHLFNLIHIQITNSLKLFKLFENAVKQGQSVTPADVEHLLFNP